tara:strand:+ start:153 stop:662 length:510 start_codon:yes stop_codon:yes gene_type:complete
MRLLIIFILILSNSFVCSADEIKNLVINKNPKNYDSITFLDAQNLEIDLEDYNGKLILLNFWATWCAPCKEEMPSLDLLKTNENLKNLIIFPINIGQDDKEKSSVFFDNLKIKNLDFYFDSPNTLAKKFGLRGIPTTIFFNKEGKEFARIIGSIDFQDEVFIDWLKDYN